MGVSVGIALLGLLLARSFYLKNPALPERLRTRYRALYTTLLNKYWIDEIYDALFVNRTKDLGNLLARFDLKVVDGAVNGSAWLTKLSSRITGGTDQYLVDGLVNAVAAFIMRLMSPLLRAAQTGFTQNYALVMVLGLVAAVAMIFGADIMKMVRSIIATMI